MTGERPPSQLPHPASAHAGAAAILTRLSRWL